MYFNLDREQKQKILDYYKKDLLDFERKKKEAKQAKIQEELKWLHQNELKERESEQKIIEEEKRKKKALMDEYLDMLRNTKILDWGVPLQTKK
jgi:DNA gyrase/topoisomerase IV subunit A